MGAPRLLITLVALGALSVVVGESVRQQLVIMGSLAEMLGVVLIAWPDVAHQAVAFGSRLVRATRVRWHASRAALGRRWLAIRQLTRRWRERAANWYRRLRGLPQHHAVSGTGGPTFGALSATGEAKVTGNLENRVATIERRLSELPEEWRADIANVKDRRIAFRWQGVSVLLGGIILTGIGNLA